MATNFEVAKFVHGKLIELNRERERANDLEERQQQLQTRINDLEEQNARLVSENNRLWALARANVPTVAQKVPAPAQANVPAAAQEVPAPAQAQRKRRRTGFEMLGEQTERFGWWKKSN